MHVFTCTNHGCTNKGVEVRSNTEPREYRRLFGKYLDCVLCGWMLYWLREEQ